MEERGDWYENDHGDFVYQWSFNGRPYPRAAPLTDLVVRITREHRPEDERPGVLIEITADGVPHGCPDHTSSRYTAWFPDPTLAITLDRFETDARTGDLPEIAYCALFGDCADDIISADEHHDQNPGTVHVRYR
jgi:hypothetical protein